MPLVYLFSVHIWGLLCTSIPVISGVFVARYLLGAEDCATQTKQSEKINEGKNRKQAITRVHKSIQRISTAKKNIMLITILLDGQWVSSSMLRSLGKTDSKNTSIVHMPMLPPNKILPPVAVLAKGFTLTLHDKCQEATLLPAKMHWIHQWLLEICQTSLACQHSCLSASRLQFKDLDFKNAKKSLKIYKAQVDLDGKAICQWIQLLPLIFNHGSAVPWHPWQLKKPWHKVASLPLSTPIKSWHAPFSAPQSSTGNSWSMCFCSEKKRQNMAK